MRHPGQNNVLGVKRIPAEKGYGQGKAGYVHSRESVMEERFSEAF